MKFTKMQGLGNDFIVVKGPIEISSQQVAKYCDRHFGIGADAFIIVSPLENNSLRMQYWNADGSFAEMCGNGLRCAARFAVDNKLVQPGEIIAQTDAGELKVTWDGSLPANIEAQIGKVRIDNEPLLLHGTQFYKVDVGNPHAVTFVENTETALVETLGPMIENEAVFPNKNNVEFVQLVTPNSIKMRVWERGDGETLACGTAMVASAAVAVRFKGACFPLEVEVPGGKSKIWLDKEGYCCMNGPAEVVFIGELA